MVRAACMLLGLAGIQDEDVYKTLSVGDRVRITFRNGNTITGNLVALPSAGTGRARPPADPVALLFFSSPGDPLCRTQEAVLEQWLRRHPEVQLEVQEPGTRPEAWKTHEVKEVPTLVFRDARARRFLKLPPGFKGENDLSEALILFRATAPEDPSAVDYLREKALTLDVGWEYPGLNGTITIPKDQIRAIRKLQALDPKILAELEQEKKRLREEIERQNRERQALNEEYERRAAKAAEEEARRAREQQEGTEEGERILREAERLKKALDVYRRFPPPEWGPRKLEEIRGRAVRKQPLSPDDQDFLQNIDLWLEAKSYHEKKKGEMKSPVAPAPPAAPEGTQPPPEEKPPEVKGP